MININIYTYVNIIHIDHGTSIRKYCKTPCVQKYPPSLNFIHVQIIVREFVRVYLYYKVKVIFGCFLHLRCNTVKSKKYYAKSK